MESEVWRDVVGYEGWYQVSDHGRVKRIKPGRGTRAGYVLSADTRKRDGYRMLNLLTGTAATRKLCYVHRLVAEAFLGPIPPGWTVNHIDCNTGNNHIRNLEIVTDQRNKLHASENGLIPRGNQHWSTRLTEDDVRTIRQRGISESATQIAKAYGVTDGCIRDILKRRNWKHVA